MGMWDQILLGGLAVGVLLIFGPGAKRMLKESPKGGRDDWMEVLRLAGIVVLGVVVMIWLVQLV